MSRHDTSLNAPLQMVGWPNINIIRFVTGQWICIYVGFFLHRFREYHIAPAAATRHGGAITVARAQDCTGRVAQVWLTQSMEKIESPIAEADTTDIPAIIDSTNPGRSSGNLEAAETIIK